jgi:cell shape-determining protein MreC
MPVTTHNNQSVRRKMATEREVEREKRSPREQLHLLDQRLGKGLGAKKERERLTALLSKEKTNA